MKTTIDFPDALLARAKRLAVRCGTTLKRVMDDALRQEKRPRLSSRLCTHTFRGRGLQPGLAWDDWSAIRDLAYQGRGT
jgi:hypothetical protein